jgi:hypothetical protein
VVAVGGRIRRLESGAPAACEEQASQDQQCASGGFGNAGSHFDVVEIPTGKVCEIIGLEAKLDPDLPVQDGGGQAD